MNISDVAKNRLNQQSDSFYEEKGLVTPPLRSENGYRTYSQQHLDELTLLRRARQVGFNRRVPRAGGPVQRPVAAQRRCEKRTLEKVADIENHIRELQNMRAHLLALAESCPGDDSAECPIIDNLSGCCHRKAQA